MVIDVRNPRREHVSCKLLSVNGLTMGIVELQKYSTNPCGVEGLRSSFLQARDLTLPGGITFGDGEPKFCQNVRKEVA